MDRIIHNPGTDQMSCSLSKRVDICVSVASGMQYLHHGYDFPIIHCDLKPSNILLDGDWVAHVSDFGTARVLGVQSQDTSSISSSAAFEGSIGYLAPEFAYMGKVTTKVDVFSFGVILMEFLTKKRPTATIEAHGLPISLQQLVERALASGKEEVSQVLDPVLVLNDSKEQGRLEELLKLALSCTAPNPDNRPDMNEILPILLKLRRDE